MSQLNQVLLREEIRFGADLDAWLANGGGAGLNKALQDTASIIPIIRRRNCAALAAAASPPIRNGSL